MNSNQYISRIAESALFLVTVLAGSLPCHGQVLSIDPGNIGLNPGEAGQTLDLFVTNSGGDLDVGGLQLNVAVTVVDGQSATRPAITAIDIITGTVFSGDNAGLFGGRVNDFKWEIGTIADFSPPDPRLSGSHPERVARITFDTTGVQPGNWTFSLTTGAGPSSYADVLTGNPIPMNLSDGILTVVPEVNGAPAIAFGLAAFGFLFRKSIAGSTRN